MTRLFVVSVFLSVLPTLTFGHHSGAVVYVPNETVEIQGEVIRVSGAIHTYTSWFALPILQAKLCLPIIRPA